MLTLTFVKNLPYYAVTDMNIFVPLGDRVVFGLCCDVSISCESVALCAMMRMMMCSWQQVALDIKRQAESSDAVLRSGNAVRICA